MDSKWDEFYRLFPDTEDHIRHALNLVDQKTSEGKIGVIAPCKQSDIPIIFANGRCLPEAWENSLLALFAHGNLIKTQYDKPGDPPSIDATMITVIEDPLAEPMIHRSFPGGLEDLEEYRQEVVDGIKDHWVRDPDDPNDTRWEYTYHGRMHDYVIPEKSGNNYHVDQFLSMADILAKSPITRRAQMISWLPWIDLNVSDPPCWQSLWGRIMEEQDGNLYLNLNMRFRSRDAYKAAFMNDFAFIDLARNLAERISCLRGEEVRLGRFMDQSDSYHIYGSYFREFADNFLKNLFARPNFDDRTWTTEFAAPIFEEARPMIRKKIADQDAKYGLQNTIWNQSVDGK